MRTRLGLLYQTDRPDPRFWREATLPFQRYQEKTENINGTLFLNSDKSDPSEDKSYIFTQEEFHEVNKTYKLIVTMLALFHSI